MPNTVKSGILLGVLVEIWTAVVIVARWHVDPVRMNLFFLVIPLQIAILVMALRKEAPNAGYGKQVLNGLVVSLVAAAIVFAGSYLLTTSVFPNYFAEVRVAGEAMLVEIGGTPDQVAEDMAKNAAMYRPLDNSIAGAIGTTVTGLVVSLVAAAFLRRKV